MNVVIWWDGAARRRLDEALRRSVRRWQNEAEHSEAVEHFDRQSRLKLALLYATTLACFGLYTLSGNNAMLGLALLPAMGLFSIPYTRVFMHSQMHWGMSRAPLTRFLLDHLISLQFSLPQTGYVYGHRLHHRHDNDLNAQGLPKDLQSTYVFSRDGEPTQAALWIPWYLLIFQTVICAALVLKSSKRRDQLAYLLELCVIIGAHALLFALNRDFYLLVYLPALLVAWTASSIVLYVMHAVDAGDYGVHPTNNSHSRFFNRFGDNDGYHLEHTLFPGLHPLYLPRVHALLPTPAQQNLKEHYVIAFFKQAMRRSKTTDAPIGLPEAAENPHG